MGLIELPAYLLPLLVVRLIVLSKRYGNTLQPDVPNQVAESKGASHPHEQKHTRDVELLEELSRIAMFQSPMGIFACVVSFCSSCMGWRWVITGLPATPSSFGGGGLFGGLLFLIFWCVAGFLKNGRDRRAYRDPKAISWSERRFAADVMVCTIAVLMAFQRVAKAWVALA